MLLFRNDMDTNKRLMYHSLVFPLFFLFCFWFVFLIEKIFGYDFHTLGIYPLTTKGLIGILTMPLIHVDVIHILVNSISFFLLSVLLFSNYRKIALPYYGNFCAICKYDKIVNVHHIDGDRSNNKINNLIVLCPNHHAEVHKGFIEDISFFQKPLIGKYNEKLS